jgi:hypothetical protein
MDCPICYDNTHVLFFPCEHYMCIKCFNTLIKENTQYDLLCPMCRGKLNNPSEICMSLTSHEKNGNKFYYLGYIFEMGLFKTTKSLFMASDKYTDAFSLGSVQAIYQLGKLCLDNGQTEQAIKYMITAEEQKYCPEPHILGNIYVTDKYNVKNYTKAFTYFEKSTNPSRYYMLGFLYENGYGCTKDLKKAYDMYSKGSDSQDLNSRHKLGYFREKGLCVEKDCENALKIYELNIKHYRSCFRYCYIRNCIKKIFKMIRPNNIMHILLMHMNNNNCKIKILVLKKNTQNIKNTKNILIHITNVQDV